MLKDCTRGQISRLFGSALIAAAIMPLSVSIASAQAGSIGGTIGKQGKSASGSEEVQKPPKGVRSRAQSAAPLMGGSWLVKQDCNHGKYQVELNLTHTSPSEFTGTSLGITTGLQSQVVDGRINGNSVTFTRQAGGLKDLWTAQLKGPGRFAGTSKSSAWRCTYTAVRK